MSENVCDNRPLALPNPDTNISNIKQEFSSIFYEYNLDTFAEAAELGFYNNNKSPLRSEMLPSDENESTQEETTKKEYTSQTGAIKPPACSTDTFFTSNVSFTSSHKKPLEQGGLVVSRRPSQTLEQSPFLNIKEFFQSNEYIDTHPDEPLDLVWSNEPSKLADHKTSNSCVFPLKIKQEEQHNQKGQNYPMKKIEADDLLQYEYLSYSNPLEYFSKPDKDFPRPSKVKKEEEVTFGHHDMSSMSMQLERNPFPIKALDDDKKSFSNKRPWNPPAPPIKRAETCPVVEDDDKDAKNRSSRGLRVLSLRVKDIVGEKKKTSYKEVADILTDETLQLLKGKEEPRDEQNIKRRAYDALNVLIAADILKKEGKVVYCDDDLASIGINKRKQMKEEKEGMEKRIFELKKKNKATTEAMKELMFKFLAIKNLIKRNKHDTEDKKLALHSSETESTSAESTRKLNRSNSGCNPTRIDVVKNCPDFKFNNEDVIRFPFIVLVSSTPENSMNLNMAGRQRRLEIESSSPFNIFGDIDVLLKMKLHHVPYTFVKECIPRGIENYLSQSDLETFEH